MEALPEFEVLSPTTLGEALAARQAHPEARLVGGGTDLVVNVRRRGSARAYRRGAARRLLRRSPADAG